MARIAVIGAGMGAMAAAARLAVAGHRVVVYERTGTYGGALGRFERDGFSFDTGPGLLPLPAVWRDLFVKTGREPLESCVELVQVDPSARHVFADGTEVALPNASRAGVVEALDAALGQPAGRRWSDFLVRAREAWDRTRRPLLEEPLWPNWEVLAERDPYPSVPHKRLLRTRRAGTLAEVGVWELRDARLSALLGCHALAYGLDPRTAPANTAVLPYMEYAFGMWYVRGGLRELARAVYERCLARRVEFRFDAEVTGIVEKDGRVAGVELAEGGLAQAELVVAGVAPDVLGRLCGGVPVRGAGDVPPQRGGTSRLTVHLALRGRRAEGAAHRTVVHAPDAEAELEALFGPEPFMPGRPTVTVLRPDDPALVPDADHEAVTLTSVVPARATPDAEEAAARLVDAAERAMPGLRDRLLWREVRTPADVAAATGVADG
ncbi:NAD(P)/FAD-dependent oxidoreductase, partial [Streptomyces parvulus]|uniref:phytoene desaturase family protein n=1 Tax=Streptomyces parvulus TaxID=146923 RepID=UPI0033B4864F